MALYPAQDDLFSPSFPPPSSVSSSSDLMDKLLGTNSVLNLPPSPLGLSVSRGTNRYLGLRSLCHHPLFFSLPSSSSWSFSSTGHSLGRLGRFVGGMGVYWISDIWHARSVGRSVASSLEPSMGREATGSLSSSHLLLSLSPSTDGRILQTREKQRGRSRKRAHGVTGGLFLG